MTGGQTSLLLAAEEVKPASKGSAETTITTKSRGPLRVIKATDDELLSHKATLQRLDKASDGQCVWLKNVN
jgi:DNA polymerase-3 subunit epsilon